MGKGRPCGRSRRCGRIGTRRLGRHTWYVGVGVLRNATSAAQRSRHGLPHAFGLSARLRAFSCGYRAMPIPHVTDNRQKARSRPLRLAPSPDAWGTRLPKGHDFTGSHPRLTVPYRATTACGRLRRGSLLEKAPRACNAPTSPVARPALVRNKGATVFPAVAADTTGSFQPAPRRQTPLPPELRSPPPETACSRHLPRSQPDHPTLAPDSGLDLAASAPVGRPIGSSQLAEPRQARSNSFPLRQHVRK